MVNEISGQDSVAQQPSSSSKDDNKFGLLECGKRLAMAGKFEQSFEYFEKCCSLFEIEKEANLKEYLSSKYFYANARIEYYQNLKVESESDASGGKGQNGGLKRERECTMCSKGVPFKAIEDDEDDDAGATSAKQNRLEDYDEKNAETLEKGKDFLYHSAFLEEIDNLLANDMGDDDAIDSDSQSESCSEPDQLGDADHNGNDDDVTISTHPNGSVSTSGTPICEENESPLHPENLISKNPSKLLLLKSISLLELVCNHIKPIIDTDESVKLQNTDDSNKNSLPRDFCIRLYGIALYKLGVAKAEVSETEELEKIFGDSIRVLQIPENKDHLRISEVSFTAASILKTLGKLEKAQKLLELSIAEMKMGISLVESDLATSKDESQKELLRGKIEKNQKVLQEIENYLAELKTQENVTGNGSACI